MLLSPRRFHPFSLSLPHPYSHPLSAATSPDQKSPSAQVRTTLEFPASHPPSAGTPTPTTAMVCPKGTCLHTRKRTGTGSEEGEEEADAVAGREDEDTPWKAETRRAAQGEKESAAANRRREGLESAATTAVEGREELLRFRAAAARGREDEETAAAVTRILRGLQTIRLARQDRGAEEEACAR